MKIKKGQKVYYYRSIGPYMGVICEGVIDGITKDLTTEEICYQLNLGKNIFGYPSSLRLAQDQIYLSKSKAESEYKDELRYGTLINRIESLEKLLDETLEVCKDKEEKITLKNSYVLCANNSSFKSDLYIEGIGNVKEEISKMKKDISDLKKKFKPKTKKPVVDKKEDESKKWEFYH